MMPLIESGWTYRTGASGGVSLAVSLGGGWFTLADPADREVTFYYGVVGAGVSAGLKLPRLGKLEKTTTGSLGSFRSGGIVLVNNAVLEGRELVASDFEGTCAILEGGGGLLVGATGDVVLFGLGLPALAAVLATPLILTGCPGALLIAGMNAGFQANVGITAYLGRIWIPLPETPEGLAAEKARRDKLETIGHNF
jgi:hypothetical protein